MQLHVGTHRTCRTRKLLLIIKDAERCGFQYDCACAHASLYNFFKYLSPRQMALAVYTAVGYCVEEVVKPMYT